jgi:hypothetical protein
MGIPADDAARLAMNIVIEQRRAHHPSAYRGRRPRAETAQESTAGSRPRLYLVGRPPDGEAS